MEKEMYVPNLSVSDALSFIHQLQQFVLQRNDLITSLREEIHQLRLERDELKKENFALKKEKKQHFDGGGGRREMTVSDPTCSVNVIGDLSDSGELILTSNSTLESISSAGDSGVCMANHETASHGESTSYDLVDEKRETQTEAFEVPATLTPKKSLRSGVARRHLRSNSGSLLELSVDLRDKTIACLENRYGGKELANSSARKIQLCYRHWVLSRRFLKMRASTGRKRSLTMPEKHFQHLKKTSLVFYGPDNPVMIIDGESAQSAKIRHKSESDMNDVQPASKEELVNDTISLSSTKSPTTVDELVKNERLSLGPHSTDSENEEVTVDEADEDRVVAGLVESHFVQSVEEVDKDNDERSNKDFLHAANDDATKNDEKAPEARSESRTSSEGSSQYEIIDDSNVLTVEGKHVDLVDGSSFVVDRIHNHEDHTDGLCFSTENQYESTSDKSMQKRQFRIGVNLFNWKPEVGIQYLIDNGLLETDAGKIADFLRKQTTISKQKISEYFGNLRNEFNNQVLLEFAKSFDFVDKDVDEALRQFQSYFKLTGEAQTVEKFLQVFAERYVVCNPGRVSDNPDTILLLAFALAMLNTDLHNQNVKRRMTADEFMRNLRGTNDGNDLDQTMLREMYTRIQKNEFATGADHMTQLHQIENSFIGKVPNLTATHRQFVKLFTVEEVYDPSKKEKPHHRLAFLFNDLLLLAKPRGKPSTHGSGGHMFSCKSSYSLLGKRVAEFSNEHCLFGVLLLTKLDNKAVATFNLKDEKTKNALVEELDEYIRETNGIENIRIALSKAKQLSWHNRRKDDGRTKSLLIPDDETRSIEKAETTSLMDLRINESSDVNELRDASGKMVGSSSMGNIRETSDESDDDISDKIVRTSSATSLDPRIMSSPSRRSTGGFLFTIREAINSPSVRRKGSTLPTVRERSTLPAPKEHRRSMPVLSSKHKTEDETSSETSEENNSKNGSVASEHHHQQQEQQKSSHLSATLPHVRTQSTKKQHSHVFANWVPKIKKSQSSNSSQQQHQQHNKDTSLFGHQQKKREKSPSPLVIKRSKSPSFNESTKIAKDEKRKSFTGSLA